MSNGLTCQFWPNVYKPGVECGKPATHRIETVARGNIAGCSDCVKESGRFFTVKPLAQCIGNCGTLLLDDNARCVRCFERWVLNAQPAKVSA